MSPWVGTGTEAGELRLILAGDGQTRANVDHLLDTRLPGPGLTALGREQNAALAGELAAGDEGVVDAVYHSRARRAGETARIVAEELGLAPFAVDGVHRIQVGDLRDWATTVRSRSSGRCSTRGSSAISTGRTPAASPAAT